MMPSMADSRIPGDPRLRASLSCLVAVFALVATACDGGLTGTPPASDTPTNLRVLMSDDWADTRPFIDAVRTFEQQHPRVRVQIDKLPAGDVLGTVDAMVKQKTPPDVVQGHAFAAAARDLAQPVDDLWNASALQNSEFLPGAVEDVTWAARRYGVPLDTNAVVLFYNAQLFADANVPPPDTWKTFGDLERAALALSTPDGTRRALVLSDSTWRAYGWMTANGGEVVEVGPDGKPHFTIDSAANVEALRFLRGLIDKGLAFHPSLGAFARDALSLLRSGAASVYPSGSNDLVALRRIGGAENVKVAIMPDGLRGLTEGSSMGGSSLFMPQGVTNRQLAFDFMRHVTSDTYALRFAKEENRLPVRPRVYRDPFLEGAESQTVLTQLQSARVYKLEAFAVARQAFGDAIRDALSGAKEPEAALRDAQAMARASVPS
jgi:multiple sugar transport system substrate-binding protein